MEVDAKDTQQATSRSTRQIDLLNATDAKLSSLLEISSKALTSLHPNTAFASPDEQQSDVEANIAAYFTTLNQIQIELRSSIRVLRQTKASSLPLLYNLPAPTIMGSGVDLDPAKTSNLSASAVDLQLEAWSELVEGLKELKGKQ